MPSARSAAASLGLGIASVVVTLGLLELVLSALFEPALRVWQVQELFQLDEELIYSLKPDQERIAESEEFVERVTTNHQGLRDAEIAPRGDFEERIVVLGDSMIFGHGVDDDETFPNQLEAVLRADGRRADVINAGVKGYGTDSAYKFYLERLEPLDLAPDLVIFAIYVNDLHDNIGQPLYTIEAGRLAPLDPTRNWLYLIGSIDQRLPAFLRASVLYSILASRLVGRDVFSVLPDLDEAGLIDWSAHKALLQVAALQTLGRRKGFRVMVLCVPYREGPPDFYAWLAPLTRLGIWIVDPSQAAIWQSEKDRLFFPTDPHFSPTGNRTLAEMVAAALPAEQRAGSESGAGPESAAVSD